MTPSEAPSSRRDRLPRTYVIWLSGVLASMLGDTVLYFALGWTASAHGGSVAALVLTAINLPRALLLLIGGAVGDRFGARKIMLMGDSTMIAVTVLLAVVAFRWGTATWLLIGAGLLIGAVDAFYLPASGSMPRRLVGAGKLPRALALRQTGGQVVALAGGSLGGLVVAAVDLPGAALFDAATFGIVLWVMTTVRPTQELPASATRKGALRDVADGLRVAWRSPVLRAALLLVAAAAGALLPVITLLMPLFARRHGWASDTAGFLAAAQSLGIIGIAVLVAGRGGSKQPGRTAALGLIIGGCGTALLALAPSPLVAAGGSLIIGLGSGVFSTHIAPLVLVTTPDSHLSRLQALLTLVQSTALLAMNNVLGNLAAAAGPALPLGICAAAVTLIGLGGLCSADLRRATAQVEAPVETGAIA
ncbi:MFS transporter [Actinoallomurus sp. NPDC050550]|uniref:MFS transporter n=1 Tax=Actinoallomurus sp. NPDC050550 TaxID=3154937 RepID=UPI0033C8F476